MEQLTLKKMREIVGWPGGEGDGIFSPGLCRDSRGEKCLRCFIILSHKGFIMFLLYLIPLKALFKLCDKLRLIVVLDNFRRNKLKNVLKIKTSSNKTRCHPAGGAISNMYSVMIARYKFFPEVKTKGMAAAPRLVLFTSEHVGITLSLCRFIRPIQRHLVMNLLFSFRRATTPSRKPAQLWVLGQKTSSCWTLMTGFLFELLTSRWETGLEWG